MSYNTHSAISVADYILDRGKAKGTSFTPMQIIKLVYLSHGWMLGLCGRPLIDEEVEAWQYGPVIPSLYDKVKKYRASFILDNLSIGPENFDPQQQSIMNQVVDIYGQFSGIQLSQLTHEPGSPWSMVWSVSGRNQVIPNDVIQSHFSRLSQRQTESSSSQAATG